MCHKTQFPKGCGLESTATTSALGVARVPRGLGCGTASARGRRGGGARCLATRARGPRAFAAVQQPRDGRPAPALGARLAGCPQGRSLSRTTPLRPLPSPGLCPRPRPPAAAPGCARSGRAGLGAGRGARGAGCGSPGDAPVTWPAAGGISRPLPAVGRDLPPSGRGQRGAQGTRVGGGGGQRPHSAGLARTESSAAGSERTGR